MKHYYNLLQQYESRFTEAYSIFTTRKEDLDRVINHHNAQLKHLNELMDEIETTKLENTNGKDALQDKSTKKLHPIISTIIFLLTIPFIIKEFCKYLKWEIADWYKSKRLWLKGLTVEKALKRIEAKDRNFNTTVYNLRSEYFKNMQRFTIENQEQNQSQKMILNLLVYNFTLGCDLQYTKNQISNDNKHSEFYYRQACLIIYEALQDISPLLKPFYKSHRENFEGELISISKAINELKALHAFQLRDIRVSIVAHRGKDWSETIKGYKSIEPLLINKLIIQLLLITIKIDLLLIKTYNPAWNKTYLV